MATFDDSTVRRLLILAVVGVFVFVVIADAVSATYSIPDGLMLLMTVVASGALGLPAAGAVASALKKRDPGEDK